MTITEVAVLRVMSEKRGRTTSTLAKRIKGVNMKVVCNSLYNLRPLVNHDMNDPMRWYRTSAGTAVLAKWDSTQ